MTQTTPCAPLLRRSSSRVGPEEPRTQGFRVSTGGGSSSYTKVLSHMRIFPSFSLLLEAFPNHLGPSHFPDLLNFSLLRPHLVQRYLLVAAHHSLLFSCLSCLSTTTTFLSASAQVESVASCVSFLERCALKCSTSRGTTS